MGPFFYSKKEIPAKPKHSNNLSFLKFWSDIPPRAITLHFDNFDKSLNLLIPKKFLFFLNREDKKIIFTDWFCFILISLLLWAEPSIINFFGKE